MIFYTDYISSQAPALGMIRIACSARGICSLRFEQHRHFQPELMQSWQRRDDDPLLIQARRQLEEYFAGTRRSFNVALDLQGTEFQRQVWQALCDLKWGQQVSYADLARNIGRPSAARAVGAANGKNPVSIIVPCHRVLGTNGALTGYAGGIERKQFLLALEKMDRMQNLSLPTPIAA